MLLEVYRKKSIFGAEFEEEEPQITFENVSNVQILNGILYGDINGEQLTINFDHFNYNYYLKGEN